MLTKLLYSGHKVVFNKSLLTEKGALRYAKQIGGTLAPIKDYDGDGVSDFLIYDKSGKIAAINGHRLKKDDKHALKRIFYQSVPDPKAQKAMGGFQGWLNTQLFQVGPYDWKGERTVRITKENYELLQTLHQRGYLSKKPESYIPRSKKSFSSTVKTHLLDSIKFGLESYFEEHNKALWYLPLNFLRDTIYKIVVGTEMKRIAERRGQYQNIVNQILSFNRNRAAMKGGEAKSAKVNQIVKLLSEWFSKDDSAKEALNALLTDIVDKVVPAAHVIAAYFVIKKSTFVEYTKSAINDKSMNADPDAGNAARAMLSEHKKKWAAQIRQACESSMTARFGTIGIKEFATWVDKAHGLIPEYKVPDYTVKKAKYETAIIKGAKYQQFTDPRYTQWNHDPKDEGIDITSYMESPIYRRDGGRAWNQELIDANRYGANIIKAQKDVWGTSSVAGQLDSAYSSADIGGRTRLARQAPQPRPQAQAPPRTQAATKPKAAPSKRRRAPRQETPMTSPEASDNEL